MGICADIIVFFSGEQPVQNDGKQLREAEVRDELPASLHPLIVAESVNYIDMSALFPNCNEADLRAISIKNFTFDPATGAAIVEFSNGVRVNQADLPMVTKMEDRIGYRTLQHIGGCRCFVSNIIERYDQQVEAGRYPGLFFGTEMLDIVNFDEVDFDRAYLESLIDEYGERVAIDLFY